MMHYALALPLLALHLTTASQLDTRFMQAVQEAEARATYQPTAIKHTAARSRRHYPPLPPRRLIDLPSRKP